MRKHSKNRSRDDIMLDFVIGLAKAFVVAVLFLLFFIGGMFL